ncbi:MAG: undecaprenyl-diphosphate phosphatase [Gemmatimonadetes bacterium]|nr:undecaprenyl-diphosphate phosphatase [Gemmatimonadota bacterium]
MNWWQGTVLGLVQGLTEFLPISSSGHLVLAEALVGVSMPGLFVEIALHVATLLAVFIVYWRRIIDLLKGAVAGNRGTWRYLGLLAVATIPAGVIGILFKDYFETSFHSLVANGVQFLVTGVILWSTRWLGTKQTGATAPSVSGALMIGFGQAVAIVPAISRSGLTVAAGMWSGLDPVLAGEFSFLMAIPVIAGAAVLELPKLSTNAVAVGTGPLMLSFLLAMISGVFAIRWLIVLLRKGSFYRFAPYCWVVGIATIVWGLSAS